MKITSTAINTALDKRKEATILAALAIGLLAAPMTASAQYVYQHLNDGAFGINDPGTVAAGSQLYSTKDGMYTPVAIADDFDGTSVIGINDAGDLAGSVFQIDPSTISGLIRSKHGDDTIFSHPDGGTYTEGRGINNKGLVSGMYRNSVNTLTGFIYDPKADAFTDIDTGNAIQTIAHGINSKGEVVGSSIYSPGVNTPCGVEAERSEYGWLRTKKGAMIFFKVNGLRTDVRGINDAGQVVGWVTDANFVQKGYVIDAPETSCEAITVDESDLLVFPGSTVTLAEGITNSGDIVGIYFDSNSISGGFIATPQ